MIFKKSPSDCVCIQKIFFLRGISAQTGINIVKGNLKMDKDQLREKMTDMKKEMLSDLDKQLCDETNKPLRKRDCNKITELSEAIFEMSCDDNEELRSRRENSKKELIRKMTEEKVPAGRKIYRRLAVPAICLLAILGLNTASLSVFGMNIFSTARHIAKHDITVDVKPDDTENNTEAPVLEHYEAAENNLFLSDYSNLIGKPDIVIDAEPDDTVSNIKASAGDPYGIKAKCAEYGLFPDAPEYIPEGFVLIHAEDKHYIECDVVSFEFSKGNKLITFDFTVFKSADDIPEAQSFAYKHNVSEKEINGHTAYVIEENRQFSGAYFDETIRYGMYAKNIDFDECYRIMESLS